MTRGRKRVAIVGLDHYHTTGWVESLELFDDQLEIVAIYEPDSEVRATLAPRYYDPHLSARLKDTYRAIPSTDDLDALIAHHEPDIALVTLPNRDAPAAITKLAGAGVHMLVDKAAARTAAEALSWSDVARNNNVRVATGLIRRYGRGWQAARDMTSQGRLGRLLSSEAVFNTSSPLVRDPANHLFSRKLQGGGILIWLGVHDIDQLLWLTGERIVEVQAMSATVGGADIGVEDAISVAFRFESGALGTIHYAYVLPRTLSQGYLALRGEKGSLSIHNDGTVHWIGPGDRTDPLRDETISTTSAKMPGYGSMAPLVIADLLAAIDEERDPVANADGLIDALRVIDAVYEAAKSGERVAVAWS